MKKLLLTGVLILLVWHIAAQAQDTATTLDCLLLRIPYDAGSSLLLNPATGVADYYYPPRDPATNRHSDYPSDPKTQLASADGRFILSLSDSDATGSSRLMLSDLATGTERLINERVYHVVRWSPTTNHFAYVSHSGGSDVLIVASAETDGAVSINIPGSQLLAPVAFAWSPDGGLLVVGINLVSGKEGRLYAAATLNAITEIARFPLTTTAEFTAIRWSPRSDAVVFYGASDVLDMVEVATYRVQTLSIADNVSKNISYVSWSPDGQYLLSYFQMGDFVAQGYVFDRAGNLLQDIAIDSNDMSGSSGSPTLFAWTSDNRLVLQTLEIDLVHSSLNVYIPAEQRSTELLSHVIAWSLAADGKLAAVDEEGLIVYDSRLEVTTRAAPDEMLLDVTWSGASNRIYLLTANHSVLEYDPATTLLRALVPKGSASIPLDSRTIETMPCIPPLAADIACVVGGFTEDRVRYFVNLDTTLIPLDTRAWALDANRGDMSRRYWVDLKYVNNAPTLSLIDTSTSTSRVLTQSHTHPYDWSPRETLLAFIDSAASANAADALNLHLLHPDTNTPLSIPIPVDYTAQQVKDYGVDAGLAWSPDGASIAVFVTAGTMLTTHSLIFDVANQIFRTSFAIENPQGAYYSMHWSPSGQWLALTDRNTQINLYHLNEDTLTRLPYSTPNSVFQGIAWSPQETYLLTMGTYSDFDSELKIFDLAQFTQVRDGLLIEPSDDGSKGMYAWLNEHTIIASITDNADYRPYASLIDLRTGEIRRESEAIFNDLICRE